MQEDQQILTAKDAYRRAKAEHYLQRAEEYVQMARYGIARKTMETVVSLDPANEACKALRRTIEEHIEQIRRRANGMSDAGLGNGNGSRRHSRSELVLIVDQDERLLISLHESLRRGGFQTIGAGNFEEAVEVLSNVVPDIVISEVNFENGPRGFDLYSWVKTNGRMARIPFVFLAAKFDRDVLIAGKRFGVDDFILKPVDNEVVTASVQNCLSRRKSSSP
ncbi:MAG: response regulator [Bacteroidota bacterium]